MNGSRQATIFALILWLMPAGVLLAEAGRAVPPTASEPRCQDALDAVGSPPSLVEERPRFNPELSVNQLDDVILPAARALKLTDPNSAQGRKLLLLVARTWVSDGQAAAREALLARGQVLAFDTGQMGYTFTLKTSEGTHRYKGGFPLIYDQEEFAREGRLAERAGAAGIGPRAQVDPATGWVRMEEIEGKNLQRFLRRDFGKMRASKREEWTSNFLVATSRHLQALHDLGIAHLDVKPGNIMIPAANDGGKKVSIIDFGLALDGPSRAEVHEKLKRSNRGYNGTIGYQGTLSRKGKPGFQDDFESLAILVNDFTKATPFWKRNAYLGARPQLRALLALFRQPVEDAPESPGILPYDRMMEIAVKKTPSPAERDAFWAAYRARLAWRSPGQRLELLFADPPLDSKAMGLDSLKGSELTGLIDAGMKERGWKFGELENLHQGVDLSRMQRLRENPDRPEPVPSISPWRRLFRGAAVPGR